MQFSSGAFSARASDTATKKRAVGLAAAMLRALGPWTGPDIDKEFASLSGWRPGDVIEGQVYHNTNDEAGTIVLVVLGTGPSERTLECKVLACEDGCYDWYVFESGEIQNPGFYRVADGSQDDGHTHVGEKPVTTIFCWRVLNSNGLDPDLSVVKWLSGKRLENVSVSILECIQQVKKKATELNPESSGTSGVQVPLLGAFPSDAPGDVAAELAKLRLDAKDATEEGGATGKERRRAKKGERKRGRAPEPDSAKEPEQGTLESKPARRSSFEELYPEVFEPRKRSRTPRREERPRSRTPRGDEKTRKKKKETFKSRSAFESDKKADNAHRVLTKKKRKKTKKQKERTKKRARKRTSTRRSDGSSGSLETSGTSCTSEESDTSSQLFQGAASPDGGKANQTRLVDWARTHPGRLAAAQLQSMQDKVGEGEAAWDVTDTPASAKSYYLRVLKMGAAQGSMRNLREMTTLCTILDHLALGRTRQAADTVAQRLKAVEMASADGHWERAQHLELAPPDQTPLTSKSEEYLVAQELKLKAKVDESTLSAGANNSASSWKGQGKDKGASKGSQYWSNQWSYPWGSWTPPWNPFGGKGKGQKGKAYGKGKPNGKGKPPQGEAPSAGE